jgi:CheY-like chemotaxis protein
MLGGEIRVESEEGEGSTFYFTLPYSSEKIKEKNAKNEVLTPVEATPMKKLKILIVEDDESSEMLISIVAQSMAKEIISAKTGLEAVAACRNHPDLDMVLMDIRMPEMNGYSATREIRKFNKDVIIIAQTAYALEGDNEKAIEAGCNDYISKPIKKIELLEKIRKFLN